MSPSLRTVLWGIGLALTPSVAASQSVDQLVAGAGDGSVQFHFTARDGVCGDGRSFYRASDVGSSSSYRNGMASDDGCARGPVRAVIIRAGREIVKIETYAGPLVSDPGGGKDLGAVAARDAASYLLGLAGTLDGRPAREAMQPAMLADSAIVTPLLLPLVRDPARARDVRSSAIAWLARRRSEPGGVGAATVQRTLDGIVRDHNESEAIRRQGLNTLGNLDRGEGVPLLLAFAGDADGWVAQQAFQSLANSGDPRARQFLRAAVHRADLPEESRTAALRGIGNAYAVAADFTLLRELYPSLNSDRERNVIITTLASAGGGENTDWLLALAKSPTEAAGRRRLAVSALSRSSDPRVREALKGLVDR